MKILENKKAIDLRNKGYSIKRIAKELNVSTSSVSIWVRHINLNEEQIRELKHKPFSMEAINKRRNSRLTRESASRECFIKKGKQEIKKISKRDLTIMGAMLYWAEGGKTNRGLVRIANSDPAMIQIMMRFFREICNVTEGKFKGYIHIHDKKKASTSEKYWSEITGIPFNQFFKTYTKKSRATSNKRQTLPNGTFDIYVCDTKLFLRIMGIIEGVNDKAGITLYKRRFN
jgi:predicted transcriptional regulator